jgi:AhpD family alkylhydroperoxidase
LGLSPPALDGFLALSGALGRTLDLKTRNRIALATAEANGCDYCLSAHSYLGTHLAKLDDAEMALNRQGWSGDTRVDAALTFARKVALSRGQVSDADLTAVRLAGFTDAQVVEIVANVVVNVFTNFLNNVAQTDIDFPVVRAIEAA